MRRNQAVKSVVLLIGGAAVLLFTLFPIYWITISALRGHDKFFDDAAVPWPTEFSLYYFERIWSSTNFPAYFLNSLIVAVVATAVTVVLSTMMAYVLTRFRFRGSKLVQNFMLVGYMLPPMVLAIPLIVVFIGLKIDDTVLGLSVAHIAMSLPFGVWMLVSFFKTIPFDLEEAAWIDGASRLKTITKIIIPLVTPGVISVGVFTFVVSFTDYVFGLMLISSDINKTVPVGLATIAESTTLLQGDLLAGAALIAIPMVVLFAFVTRYFIGGLTAGAVKG